jgi:hypothetical protein
MFTEGGILMVLLMCVVMQIMILEMKEPFGLQKDWKRILH